MSQRTRAGLIALTLLAVLWGAAGFLPLPYVTYYPGPTVDILARRVTPRTCRSAGTRPTTTTVSSA